MRVLATFLVALATIASPARAQFGATTPLGEWIEVEGARLRVLLGSAMPDGTVDGTLEIDLEPGWKTYWIAPGPFGIPPSLDAGGSANLVLRSVEHPAPSAFREFGEVSVGYGDDVAFPLSFAMPDPGAPARLILTGLLGVCEAICVPVTLQVEGDVVTGQSTPFETGAAIRAARAALPEPGGADALSARVEGDAIVVDGDAVAVGADIFVAPPAGLTLGVAERVGGAARAPILRGVPDGPVEVIVRDGERTTRYVLPLEE